MTNMASTAPPLEKSSAKPAVQAGWRLSVESDSRWLFVELRWQPAGDPAEPTVALGTQIQQLLARHEVQNVVLEMDEIDCLEPQLIDQLVFLHKQIHQQGGLMRLSGLDLRHQRALRSAGLEDRFSRYVPRENRSPSATPRKPR